MIIITSLFSYNSIAQNSNIRPTQLTTEYLENPSIVDITNPRLAWINIAKTKERNLSQTAYQIRVSGSKNALEDADLWDSGMIKSDKSNRILYQGEKLISRQECWWQIRTWDKNGNVSNWSNPAHWKMGLLNSTDWKAKWIGAPWQGEDMLPIPEGGRKAPIINSGPPAPLFRKEFNISKKIAKAEAFVTGLGYFEFYVNGSKVGNDVLVPNQTNYGHRPNLSKGFISIEDNFKEYKVMYLYYDITDKLVEGKNAIGSILGNGFYNPAKSQTEGYGSPRFLGQIYITYTDGTIDIITSDTSWKVSKSPLLMNMVFYGEHYDARKEQKGWSSSEFDESKWKNAIVRKAPEGKLVAHTAHTDKITERIAPVSIKKLDNGNYLVDFGVEISGWVRLKNVKATKGHKIDIKFNSSDFSGDNSYIFKGEGSESYAPRFNWFVFSSIEIINWPGKLQPSQLVAEMVNTSINISATFNSSNKLLNTINTIWRRSQLDNMHGGTASDCPHRERSAYTGDAQATCNMVMQNYDARNFYQKWMQDILGAQNKETGYVPNAAPWQPRCGGGVAWGAAIAEIPWEFYLQYGAKDMLEDNYEGMKDYLRYMQQWITKDGIMHSQLSDENGEPIYWQNLGDWVTPGELPSEKLVHTFFFWRTADITAKTAAILNRKEEAKKYSTLANNVKKAFHQNFYNKVKGSYGNYGQNVFALKMGIPKEQETKVVASLKENIKSNDNHLDTGIFGTKFLFEVLTDHGLHELAYTILNQTSYPGFGNWIAQGATTTWEQWNGENSRNHPMWGGGLVWMYRKLAGMNIDVTQPGYKHIVFEPQMINELDFVSYVNNTSYGKAGITWKQDRNKTTVDVTVPVSSTATILLPVKDINKLKENNQLIKNSKEIIINKLHTETVELKVGSGVYHFEF